MQSKISERRFVVPDNHEARAVFGQFDENLKVLESELSVRVVSRGNEIVATGEPESCDRAVAALADLLASVRRGDMPGKFEVRQALRRAGGEEVAGEAPPVVATSRGKTIRPKTPGQRAYVEAMSTYDIVFGIGPAGTGKTYLAMAVAVAALKDRRINRIILVRPAVEAGEKLGFLPGDLQEKVDPYLRPLYDALFDIMGSESFEKYRERAILEIAPLAYMRGRTLEDAFVILDEAQNTTPEQMKMFLTRLGFGSKAVITGDITQIDLPKGHVSGLTQAQKVLSDISGIAFCRLTERDVVRHELVQAIIKAYEAYEDKGKEPAGE